MKQVFWGVGTYDTSKWNVYEEVQPHIEEPKHKFKSMFDMCLAQGGVSYLTLLNGDLFPSICRNKRQYWFPLPIQLCTNKKERP